MKVKFANRIYEVLFTKELAGLTMYAVEDEPNHIDWLINVEVIDAEKKELKKIEQKPVRQQCADFYNKNSELQMPRLTAFENELANILFDREYDGSTETEDDIQRGKLDYELAAIRLAPKLQSLINNEQKPAWSEEDEHRLKDTIYFLDTAKKHYASTVELDVCIDWLKSIKDRVQPKQEWGEEDEKIIKRIDSLLYSQCKIHGSEYQEIHNWLKSLQPQSHWKPSDEQTNNK